MIAWYRLSPDQLVGQGEDSRRDRDTVRPGRAEIEDQVELGRALDRELARLGPFQQLIDVERRASAMCRQADSVGHQAPTLGILADRRERWQPLLPRDFRDRPGLIE